MGLSSSKPVVAAGGAEAETEAEEIHPASIPPAGDATRAGSFGELFPVDILQRLPLSSWEILPLSGTSSFFKRNLQDQRAATRAHLEYLRKQLRLEDATLNAAPLPEMQKADVQRIKTLLEAYKGYFFVFEKAAREKDTMAQQNNNYSTYGNWPDNKELNEKRAEVEIAEGALPSRLIHGTAVGILQATAKLLQTYAEMVATRSFDSDKLDDLAVKGIGSAQRDAGEKVWDCYFRGKSMKGASNQHLATWAWKLGESLGSKNFLGGLCAVSLGAGNVVAELEKSACSSLSLINIISERLDALGLEFTSGEKPPVAHS